MFNIATFNIENLDVAEDDRNPSLEVRAPILRRVLERVDADILCLQEVHGQEREGHTSDDPKRDLRALDAVLEGTRYANYQRRFTHTSAGTDVPYDRRNLVVLSKYQIIEAAQYKNARLGKLEYRRATASPEEEGAKEITWERPIQHVQVQHADANIGKLHVINLHLKSRLASTIPGQKKDRYAWNSAAGWAEGYFMSSMKRVGQALEVRVLLDAIFDDEPDARVVVCGDFNAEPGEVPVEAICGRVENTDNPDLRGRVLIACSRSIPESACYSHLHHGHGNLLDHMLISQSLLPYFREAAIHNENLHDESLPFRSEVKYPESDHAPFVSRFGD